MRQLKVCPDSSASTTWDYAALLWNHYRVARPKRCHHSQTSRTQSPLNPFYTWCNMLLTGLHHSPVVSISLLIPSNSSILSLHFPPMLPSLTCTRLRGNHHHHLFKSLTAEIKSSPLLWNEALKTLTGTNWGQQKENILAITYIYVTYPVLFHVYSSHMVPQHLTIPYSEISNYPKLCLPHSHRLR